MNFDFFLDIAGSLIGFYLTFRLKVLSAVKPGFFQQSKRLPKISVIIPARNEEKNIEKVITSIQIQEYPEFEIIVVDDDSSDLTGVLSQKLKVKTIQLKSEDTWKGKSRACYEGYLHASGELLLFLDADTWLEPGALKSLVAYYNKNGGIISVQPYLKSKSFSEKFSLLFYLVGAFSLVASKRTEGMFGACILISKKDYEAIGGHKAVKDSVIEDVMLANKAAQNGLRVTNFSGKGMVSGELYPGGIRDVVSGWAKSFPLGAKAISLPAFLLVFFWISGLIDSQFALFSSGNPVFYTIYFIQIYIASRTLGQFGLMLPLFHFLPTAFFVIVFLYAALRILFTGSVDWKGRKFKVTKRGAG